MSSIGELIKVSNLKTVSTIDIILSDISAKNIVLFSFFSLWYIKEIINVYVLFEKDGYLSEQAFIFAPFIIAEEFKVIIICT